MIDDIEATDAEILETIRQLRVHGSGMAADAVQCIQWLQSGLAASEVDCETKRNAVEVLTEGRGIPDDDLWHVLIAERDKLKALNEDKFRTIQAYCKAASEDKAQIKSLTVACKAALTELVYLAEQVKAREGGSVRLAIQCCKNALACPECGGSGTVVKASPLAAGTADTFQEPCELCDGKGGAA